ncbi:hypothetical protein GCM10028784_15310 [Myceligenerans cantabricum]
MSGEKRAGDPGQARRSVWLTTSVLVTAAVVWSAFAVVPARLAEAISAEPPGHGAVIAGAVAGGAAAGCLAGLVRRRARARAGGERSGHGFVGAAALVGVLGAAAATLLWGGDGPEGPAVRTGIAVVVLTATAVGLGLGLLATTGPVWWRACALALPIIFGQDALDAVLPPIPVLGIDGHWFVAVLVGLALGVSVAHGRPWTWLMWIPALVLVWVAQSLVLAMDATLQQLHLGSGYLREYPLEPLMTLGGHLSQTLVTPGDHGVVAMWAIALQAGVVVAAWRLRERTEAEAEAEVVGS